MRLSSLTCLGFETTAVIDKCPELNISFAEIHAAAERGQLIAFLRQRYGDYADLTLYNLDPAELAEAEAALRDAASALDGREGRKTGVRNNGLCLVLAIVLEAIQQHSLRRD